jgi:hypothetical protein
VPIALWAAGSVKPAPTYTTLINEVKRLRGFSIKMRRGVTVCGQMGIRFLPIAFNFAAPTTSSPMTWSFSENRVSRKCQRQ